MASVAGYSILNDISARDWVPEEERSYFGLDWVMLKGFDGAAPMGPFIAPAGLAIPLSYGTGSVATWRQCIRYRRALPRSSPRSRSRGRSRCGQPSSGYRP